MGPGLPDRLGRGYARSFGAVSDMCPESLAPNDLNRVGAIVEIVGGPGSAVQAACHAAITAIRGGTRRTH